MPLLHREATDKEEIVIVASIILKSGHLAGDILIVLPVIEGEVTVLILKREEESNTLTLEHRNLEDLLLRMHLRKVSNFSS